MLKDEFIYFCTLPCQNVNLKSDIIILIIYSSLSEDRVSTTFLVGYTSNNPLYNRPQYYPCLSRLPTVKCDFPHNAPPIISLKLPAKAEDQFWHSQIWSCELAFEYSILTPMAFEYSILNNRKIHKPMTSKRVKISIWDVTNIWNLVCIACQVFNCYIASLLKLTWSFMID